MFWHSAYTPLLLRRLMLWKFHCHHSHTRLPHAVSRPAIASTTKLIFLPSIGYTPPQSLVLSHAFHNIEQCPDSKKKASENCASKSHISLVQNGLSSFIASKLSLSLKSKTEIYLKNEYFIAKDPP